MMGQLNLFEQHLKTNKELKNLDKNKKIIRLL